MTILTKSSILDIWQGSEYTSELIWSYHLHSQKGTFKLERREVFFINIGFVRATLWKRQKKPCFIIIMGGLVLDSALHPSGVHFSERFTCSLKVKEKHCRNMYLEFWHSPSFYKSLYSEGGWNKFLMFKVLHILCCFFRFLVFQ